VHAVHERPGSLVGVVIQAQLLSERQQQLPAFVQGGGEVGWGCDARNSA